MTDYIQLVRSAQQGSPNTRRAAFDELMLRFQGMALQQAYQSLGDWQLAEDAVQEAFLAAYLRIEQLREAQAFPVWLRRIVLTHCDRQIRGKRPQLESLEARFDLAIESLGPEALVEQREMQDYVQVAIGALPEHERMVTEGFYLHGESQKELAERLEIPVTTVKKRLQYARQHMRGFISDLNAAFDQAIADMLHQPKPQPQPIYLYTRQPEPVDES